jgi:hypothetical protein
MTNIFSSTDIRGYVGESLTTEYVWNVGKAFAEWLPEKGDVVVMESATADKSTVRALVEGILLQGRSVVDAGIGDQTNIISTVMDKKAAGGALVEYEEVQNLAVITFFDARGVTVMDSSGLSEINQLTDAANFLPAPEKGKIKTA